jgi:hypothetical protein
MCCLFTVLALLGPRAAILVWWLLDPLVWQRAFDTFIWPFLGFLFLPWTTLMYVLVYPGGVNGLDIVWLGLAFAFDLFNWGGGAFGNRRQIDTYYRRW